MARTALSALAVSLTILALAGAAEAGTFRYRVERYPAASGDCHQVASSLGQRFQAQTGIAATRSVCTDISAAGYTFEISYEAAERLNVVTTTPHGVHDGENGVYSKEETCLAHVDEEAGHFEERTGLAPFVAYCYRDTDQDGAGRPWAIRVEAFGRALDSALLPWRSSAIIFDQPLTFSLADLEKQIYDQLLAREVDVRWVRIHGQGLYGDLTAHYYAARKFKLDLIELSHVASTEHCNEQLALAQSVLPGRSEAPLALYCAASSIGGRYVIGAYRDRPDDASFLSAERFASYAACMADRERLVSVYAQNTSGAVKGGLCSEVEGIWRLHLLAP
jgi:hypothetical protein